MANVCFDLCEKFLIKLTSLWTKGFKYPHSEKNIPFSEPLQIIKTGCAQPILRQFSAREAKTDLERGGPGPLFSGNNLVGYLRNH